jgi:poly-gamma-glutamate synthesis protein (capsule biosynthesis protein)
MSHGFHKSFALMLSILLTCLLSACQQQSWTLQPQQAPTPTPVVRTDMVIAAVGDIMMPASIQRAVARNGHNYDILFEKISRDLHADLTFANLETQVDDASAGSGYPKFNARPGLLTALRKAGVGVLSVANNHALDAGPAGLVRTLDNIEKAGILFTGAGRTKADAEQAVSVTANGVTAAFLAYTYGTNENIPGKKKGMPAVNILRAGSEPDLAAAAARVRKARTAADLLIVSLHWGEEYATEPTVWQRRVAGELIEAGADIILGHHPHVLQPIETYAAQDGRQGLIAFSLGNFVSSQNFGIANRNRADARALRGDGIILTIFTRKEHGRTSITRAEFLPVWTVREQAGKTTVFRPVCIAREIARIESARTRGLEEENMLALLKYRNMVIVERLSGKKGGHAASSRQASPR